MSKKRKETPLDFSKLGEGWSSLDILPNGASAIILANGKIVLYKLGSFRWICKEYRLTK